ncbi:phage baseplate assembly protein [Jeongeupia chitinilytica]|uniref:phage baseplate assembly protein n=1 Tax=Jeongeupia chitinilytica TaxID=1041641 RepID=UPI001675EE97|nr:hypothetical protein [Jeongeupia chitinilytica]
MDIDLLIGGARYGGWQSVSVVRSIETLSGRFSVGLTEHWPGQWFDWPISTGDRVQVLIAGQPVITGWIGQVERAAEASRYTLSVSGRDASCDPVDCAPDYRPGQWSGLTLSRLLRALLAPYPGIPVRLVPDVVDVVLPAFKVQPGETTFRAIDRACQLAGVRYMADAAGGVLVTQAGRERASTPLVLGGNLLAISASFDADGRFSDYLVKGQCCGGADEPAMPVLGRAHDPGVTRSRPLVIRANSGQLTPELAGRRAQWERDTRAARASPVSALVAGWQQQSGDLWAPNLRVPVKAAALQVDAEMVIASLEYTVDPERGPVTKLDLLRPDAFAPQPAPAQARGRRAKASGEVGFDEVKWR